VSFFKNYFKSFYYLIYTFDVDVESQHCFITGIDSHVTQLKIRLGLEIGFQIDSKQSRPHLVESPDLNRTDLKIQSESGTGKRYLIECRWNQFEIQRQSSGSWEFNLVNTKGFEL
jgi:hypothetical protein